MRARALVARNLRRLRTRRGLSQEALAADAGIDRTYVSRLERGLENPTVAVLEQLAEALVAEIVEFFAVPAPGEPPPKPLPGGRRPKSFGGKVAPVRQRRPPQGSQ
jgi:transcriptional regulator with XRE-family HTH domain